MELTRTLLKFWISWSARKTQNLSRHYPHSLSFPIPSLRGSNCVCFVAYNWCTSKGPFLCAFPQVGCCIHASWRECTSVNCVRVRERRAVVHPAGHNKRAQSNAAFWSRPWGKFLSWWDMTVFWMPLRRKFEILTWTSLKRTWTSCINPLWQQSFFHKAHLFSKLN